MGILHNVLIIYTDYTQTTQPQSGIDLTNNPAYEVCQQRTHLSDMKNLSAQETEFNMDNNPLYTMVNAQK